MLEIDSQARATLTWVEVSPCKCARKAEKRMWLEVTAILLRIAFSIMAE